MLNGTIAKNLRLCGSSLTVSPAEYKAEEKISVLVNKTPKLIKHIVWERSSDIKPLQKSKLNSESPVIKISETAADAEPPSAKKALTLGGLLLQASLVESNNQAEVNPTNGGILQRNLVLKNMDRGTFDSSRLTNFEDYDEIRKMQLSRNRQLDRMPVRVTTAPEMERIRRERSAKRQPPKPILSRLQRTKRTMPGLDRTDLLKKRLVFAEYNTVFIFARDLDQGLKPQQSKKRQ